MARTEETMKTGYHTFTRPEAEWLWSEYQEYIQETAMSPYERRLLRQWVDEGHSVYEDPESSYLPDPIWPPRPFLEAYQGDREIKQALSGKTAEERESYLKEYIGYTEEPEDERIIRETKEQLPKTARHYIRKLQRELFQLWGFVGQEGLWEEAREFVNDHMDEEIPFEW